MTLKDGIKARVEALKARYRSISNRSDLDMKNASLAVENELSTRASSPTALSLSSLPSTEMNIHIPTNSDSPTFEPFDYTSWERPSPNRHHPIYSELPPWRRGSEGAVLTARAIDLVRLRDVAAYELLERHAESQAVLISDLQNTVEDQRIESSQLERLVKLGCGKLLGRFLRLWRCYAAKKKELKHAQWELDEWLKLSPRMYEDVAHKEELVELVMAEKGELRERCEELEARYGEREEFVESLLSEKEELRARCEELEHKLAEEQGKKFVDMETWCRLHGWEKKTECEEAKEGGWVQCCPGR